MQRRKLENKNLFDNDEDEEFSSFKTNKNYAKHYNEFRKKEVLSHLKNISESDDDSSSEDDSADEKIDADFDKEFLKTMAFLKSENPQKYNKISSLEFFSNLQKDQQSEGKQKKAKILTVADHQVQRMINTNGNVVVDDDIAGPSSGKSQREIEEDLKKAITNHHQSSDDENDDDFFKIKVKSNKEIEEEDSEYLKWINDKNAKVPAELAPLKSFWDNKNLSKEDKFLRDYIVKKKYERNEGDDISDVDLSEDEKNIEEQQNFEQEYNFRYEESDGNLINRHPRENPHSLRAEDNKRKEARKERKEKKLKEKELEMKHIREMRNIQKRDLEEKMLMLKEVAGMSDMNIDEDFFNTDFDPSKHDQMMKSTFGQDYYQIDEGDQKPEFPQVDNELEIENWDTFNNQTDDNEDQPHCEDESFNMDCDAPSTSKKVIDSDILDTLGKRKRKKKGSKLAEMIRQKKPAYDPNVMNKTYEEYLDEYYKLDFEDLIGGDLPCRFKYTECVPNDFGLSVEEVLGATNKELNQWASLKKTMQNRPKHVELNDVEKYERRRNNLNLKKKIFQSMYGQDEAEEENEDDDEKVEPKETLSSETVTSAPVAPPKKVNKKNKNASKFNNKLETSADRRLKTFEINPKKFKNKMKYKKK